MISAPFSNIDEVMVASNLHVTGVRGKLTQNAPLAPLVWFKAGGAADWLFEPADREDLAKFLAQLRGRVPVMPLGLGSNLIVRDGGVPGVVVRLPKAMAKVSIEAGVTMGWERYVGSDGLTIGIDSFGASAPAEQLFPHFGFAVDQIVPKILSRLTV